MLTGVIIALGLWGRLTLAEALVLALTWSSPEIAAGPFLVAMVLVVRTRRRTTGLSLVAGFLRMASSELRAGSSLRAALAAAGSGFPDLRLERVGRLAAAGRPYDEMSRDLAKRTGMEALAAVVSVAGTTGGSVVNVLETLAAEATDEATLQVEKRSLTAAARWSVALVGGFPLAVLATQIVRGELGQMLAAGPLAIGLVLVGVGLLLTGLLVVGLLLRRVRV